MKPGVIVEALKAVLLGLVEGITEWLPISSTGHMILVDEFIQLNVSPDFLVLFLVVIQIGSIMAVIMGIIAIRFLMGYIKKNDFTIFGVYRIIIGVIVLAYFGAQALGVF